LFFLASAEICHKTLEVAGRACGPLRGSARWHSPCDPAAMAAGSRCVAQDLGCGRMRQDRCNQDKGQAKSF